MFRRYSVLALLAALVSPPVLGAQARPAVEIGGFFRWDVFDASLAIDDFFANGGRVGVSVLPTWAVEADVSRISTNGPPGTVVTNSSIHLRFLHDRPLVRRVWALMGIGLVRNDYGASRSGSENGLTGLLGIRVPISDLVAVRLDATADYIPSPANASATVRHNWNYGIAQGLSLTLGKRRKPAEPEPADSRPTYLDTAPPPPAATAPVAPPAPPVASSMTPVPPETIYVRVPVPVPAPVPPAGGETVAETDRDGDSIADHLDRCLNTPPGVQVDGFGCPLDGDRDRVPDFLDRCPNSPAGSEVDERGCLELFETGRTTLVLEGVHFAHGKADLTYDSRSILDNVAEALRAKGDVRVMVEGHTSIVGAREFNVVLSRARAQAVREYLIGEGVRAGRLEAEGFGPDRPVASNATEDGQAKNRRVELRELK